MAMTRDAAARAQALDPTRSFIVQAPAGSGKTELLTQRFLRLLATVEYPEQIVALTFTRKAAAEMRSRILRAFENAAGPAPDTAHKRATWDLARAVRDLDAQRGWGLTKHPARLRIQTIDALNALLARRLPVLSASGAALEPTEDARPLYEAASAQLIQTLGRDADLRGLEALITHLGNNVPQLIELLSDLLARRDQWLHQIMHARSLDDVRAVLEATLRSLISHQLQRVGAALGVARRHELLTLAQFAAGNLLADGRGEKRRLWLEACVAFNGALEPDAQCLSVWRAMAGALFTGDSELYKSITKTQGFPTHSAAMKQRMNALLDDLRRPEYEKLCEQLRALLSLPDPQYSPAQWGVVQALLEVLPLAVRELRVVFQREGKSDYVEAALLALQALGETDEPTDLALALDYRLQHILVDECQDTSFTQRDLLERLTAGWTPGDGRTLFCVGDPMQSIYRFRQADVGLFLELQASGLPNVSLMPLTLSENFRSTKPIVEWVNRVFPRVFSPVNDAEQGAIAYSPSHAARVEASGGVHVHAALSEDEAREAREITRLIRDALARDDASTIAVLVSARTHVAALSRELANAGIDYQAVEIELLRERPVVQDLIALTRALLHLGDRTAWLSVLRAPWCGLSLHDLHAIASHDRAATIRSLLERALAPQRAARTELHAQMEAAQRLRKPPPASQRSLELQAPAEGDELSASGRERASKVVRVLEAALAERGRWPLREWVERTWIALQGPATLAQPQDLDDADAFFRRLRQLEVAGDLDDITALEPRLDRLFAQPRAQGPARVDVMTVHKAKGLEFDVVILPGLQRRVRGEKPELLRWARIAGSDGGIVLAPIKADGAAADPIYSWIEQLEEARIDNERARLLYVAATRARCELHLFGSAALKSDDTGVKPATPGSGTMLRMLWSEVEPAFIAASQAQPAAQHAATEPPRVDVIRRLPAGWRAPPADASVPHATPTVSVDLERPEFDWVSEVSRHVGTLVHRELDRIARRGGSSDLDSLSRAAPRLRAELSELGVPRDRAAEAADRVLRSVANTLEAPRGRWLLGIEAPLTQAQSELALSGIVAGELVNGVIDRTFIDEQGVRWIVDFKTSAHEGGGLEAFLDAEVNRYRPQLLRYATLMRSLDPRESVKAALYFPLLKQWREVTV